MKKPRISTRLLRSPKGQKLLPDKCPLNFKTLNYTYKSDGDVSKTDDILKILPGTFKAYNTDDFYTLWFCPSIHFLPGGFLLKV